LEYIDCFRYLSLLTKREKLDLERFGCALKASTGVFLIDWKGQRDTHAPKANIFACLVCIGTMAGPIALLALEISPVRPLPRYFYFPFDLKSKAHRKWLSRLTSTGTVRLLLVNGKRSCPRTHELSPYLRLRASDIYAEAVQQYDSLESGKYDFNRALQLMERYIRIPQLVHRVLPEDTLREISKVTEEATRTVPSENRERANGIVRAAAEAFGPYFRNNRKALLETLSAAQFGLTGISDIHREFVDNPDSLTKFVSDALAATLARQQLDALAELVALLVAIPKLRFTTPTEQKEQAPTTALVPTIPELPAGLAALVHSMGTSGISKDAAARLLRLVGLEVGRGPGRPSKDYSREYELKRSLSWTNVARQILRENLELREEFGGRDFDSLSFEEQENLRNRIREGVRSYAERTKKPFPIESVEALSEPDSPAEK
jgi:hypothetical protein